MKLCLKYACSFLLALVLAGCGGGESTAPASFFGKSTAVSALSADSSSPTVVIPVVASAAPLSGVTFENVPINGGSQGVFIGQIGVTFAQVTRTNNAGAIRPVKQLVFTNLSPYHSQAGQMYPVSLKYVFPNKDLTLRDAKGDMSGRIPYFMSYEDEKIIITFEGGGYYGTSEQDLLTLVGTVATYANTVPVNLSLTNVVYQEQLEGNLLVAGSTVTNIKWAILPMVESLSPKLQYLPYWNSVIANVANVRVTFPTDGVTRNTAYLDGVETVVIGGRDIMFADGYSLYNKKVDGDVSSFSTNFSVGPGESSTFSLNVMSTNYYLTSEISKMVFVIGGVKFVPYVTGSDPCGGVLEPLIRFQCLSGMMGGKG